MRILHVSDLHISGQKVEKEKNELIIQKLLNEVEIINQENKIDFIIFTGDAINRGGEGYSNIEEAFRSFESSFINPLLGLLSLNKSHFIMCPGNHDILRKLDNEVVELGTKSMLKNNEEVHNFIHNDSLIDTVNRIKPYKQFEKYFYDDIFGDNGSCLFPLQSLFKKELNGIKVGFLCLNSAWRCYDSSKDSGNILIGKSQIEDCLHLLNDCDIKIAISHHHYSWMHNMEKDDLRKMIISNFNLYFCGHTHSPEEELVIKPYGRTFTIVSPGVLSANVFNDGKYKNGFSVIDYDVNRYKFNLVKYKEDINYQFSKDSTWETDIPCGEQEKDRMDLQRIVLSQREETDVLNKHLLTYNNVKTIAPKCLSEIFVMPTLEITDEKYDENTKKKELYKRIINSIRELVDMNDNIVIFGIKESGKTILLDKILLEILDNQIGEAVPIVCDFNEIENNMVDVIRKNWGKSKNETNRILDNGLFILLIDNMKFATSSMDKLEVLKKFLDDHNNIRFIGTCRERKTNDLILNTDVQSILKYKRIELSTFKTKQIREMTSKWFTKRDMTNKTVDLLVKTFTSLNLPCTPFAISMFLFIFEQQGDSKPRNNAMLIEMYLSDILKTLETSRARADIFDYKNRMRLLSHIARYMLKSDDVLYQIQYSMYLSIIENYLREMHFDKIYSPTNIAQDFINVGIMIKEQGDMIHFRFNCFFEFSLAYAMKEFPDFKTEVLAEENYLSFMNEIIYYTGLYRGEADILETIMDRMDREYQKIAQMIPNDGRYIDNMFNANESILERLDSNALVNALPEKRSDEDVEKSGDLSLQFSSRRNPENIERKERQKTLSKYSKLLLLSMNVLKNSEEIQKEGLKYGSYVKIIGHSISYAMIIHSVAYNLMTKSEIPEEQMLDIKFLYRFLPFMHEQLLNNNMATYKLTEVIKNKIEKDKKNKNVIVSEFEQYISILMYFENNGKNSKDLLKEFLHSFNRVYIADALFLNLLSSYYMSTNKDDDAFLINNIADLYLRINPNGNKSAKKNEIIQRVKKTKKDYE